jgi:hypothetical protein
MERSYPKFLKVPQSILNWHEKKPMTYAAVLETAEDIGKLEQVQKSDFALTATYGTGVYAIQDDGSLLLLKHAFDTSD